MGRETYHNAIRTRFKNEIEDVEAELTGDVVYDNAPVPEKPENTTWARVSIIEGANNQVDVGNTTTRFRTLGNLMVQLFAPLGSGDKVLNSLADKIVAKFRKVRASGIVYRVPTVQTVGTRSGEWQINVTIPFLFDEIV